MTGGAVSGWVGSAGGVALASGAAARGGMGRGLWRGSGFVLRGVMGSKRVDNLHAA